MLVKGKIDNKGNDFFGQTDLYYFDIDLNEEKKIKVGNILKAKFIKGPSTILLLNDLKRKSLPASEKLSRFFIKISIVLKKGIPIGLFKIIIAKNICKLIPHTTVRVLIAFLLLDNA